MKVLLIDDSPEIANTVSLVLKIRWPNAILVYAPTGNTGIEMVGTHQPQLAVVDINLPDMEGYDVLRQIRRFSNIPAIFLSVRDSENDKVRGLLDVGADDYITKPFSAIEFVARVQAVLRRSGVGPANEDQPSLVSDNLKVDFATGEVWSNGRIGRLTPTENRLLRHLVSNEGRVVTHQSLRRVVWDDAPMDRSIVKKYVYQLRGKLGDNHRQPPLITSERGMGYLFARRISPESTRGSTFTETVAIKAGSGI